MKILHIATHLNYGGISTYVVSLARALKDIGHDIYCASSGGDQVKLLKEAGLGHISVPIKTKCEINPLLAYSFFKLKNIIRAEKIQLIHAHTRVGQILAENLSKHLHIPYVSTCHGFFKRNFGRHIFPAWGDRVIAISDAVKKHLMVDFFVPEDKIALIHNGIDTGRFSVSPKRTDSKYLDRKLGIIARLSVVKGHTYLIEAMAEICREYPDARLFIFGEGKIKYNLIRQAEKLKIPDKILFLPSVSNIPDTMQEIDIFVMPSLQEGLGLSILEAQACGLPVVASNVGGIPSVIKHDVNGLLVPPKNAPALAGAIMKILDNRDLSMRLGKRARRDVEQKFSLEIMAGKMEQLYQEVLNK